MMAFVVPLSSTDSVLPNPAFFREASHDEVDSDCHVRRSNVLGLAVPSAIAQTLKVGDAAPKMEVKSFVKGEPVKEFEAGKTYVVEFWATWCGPCKTSIPHLTELQKKYPEVAFIGVSVSERDQGLVKPFVDEMGDKMAYRVAIDAVPEGQSGQRRGHGQELDGGRRPGRHSDRIHRRRRWQDLLDRPSHGDGRAARKDRVGLVGPEDRNRRRIAAPRRKPPRCRKVPDRLQAGDPIGRRQEGDLHRRRGHSAQTQVRDVSSAR